MTAHMDPLTRKITLEMDFDEWRNLPGASNVEDVTAGQAYLSVKEAQALYGLMAVLDTAVADTLL